MNYWFSLLLLLSCLQAQSQITDSIPAIKFNAFQISSQKQIIAGKTCLFIRITKNGQLILIDSVITDVKNCTGFSVPLTQPISGYFIFTKRERHNGKTYILSKTDEYQVIAGGTFWATPKHKLLFILAEKDYTNLLIYSLKDMKTILEKFNCDEFTGWYYSRGSYLGKVVMECGEEPESEKEVTGFIRNVQVENFNPKSHTLNEANTNDEELEKAKVLERYAVCK